jgi:hypothetical protein
MNRTGGVMPNTALWLLLTASLWFAAPLLASAQVTSEIAVDVLSVEVGVGGEYKRGHWTPVTITLEVHRSCQARLVLTTADGEGLSAGFADPELHAVRWEPGTIRVERYVKFGQLDAGLLVEVVLTDGLRYQRAFSAQALPPSRASTSELIVVLGEELGIAQALPLRPYRIARQVHVVPLDWSQIPGHPLGLDGVDLIVASTSALNADQIPPDALRALCDWVHLGGRLVISCAASSESLFNSSKPLSSLAPGEFERVASLRRTAALESFAGSAQRLEAGPRTALDIAQFQSVRGRIELAEGAGTEQQPLIVHYPVGFGQVSLITVDLDREPLNAWAGRAPLLARVLAFHQPGETGRGQAERQTKLPAQLGYADMAGQLRMALDQFPGVTLVAFSWVAGLIAIYIVLIGPGDYLLVRHGLRRMQATWCTLGLFSVSFLIFAWWLQGTLKSDETLLNQADVIDVDLASGVARGVTWAHLYSPRTATYDVAPQIAPLHAEGRVFDQRSPLSTSSTTLSWHGLPGEGLGGLDGRPAPRLFDAPYEISVGGDAALVRDVPLQAASTKGFITRWWRPGLSFPHVGLRDDGDGLITGQFHYPLELPLEDCMLVYENWLYRFPRPLRPRQTIDVNSLSTPRNLHWQLTQKRTIDAKDIVTPWNPRSTDTERILEMMLFHQAAGGDAYTGLTQRFDTRIDLSDHLRTGRAMLVGRTTTRVVAWREPTFAEDDAGQTWNFVRVLIPVAPPASTP